MKTIHSSRSTPTVKQPPHDYLFKEVTVREPGFAYVFVSNEHPTYVDLYFDDVTVTHTPSPIVSSSDYFAFGLQHTTGERTGVYEQRHLYNGKELQDELSLGIYDYGARFYSPEVGRWWHVDPLTEKYFSWNPYNYTFNNPILFVDKDGRDGMVTVSGSGSKTDPITYTIKANYYYNTNNLTKSQAAAIKQSISNFNSTTSNFKDKAGNHVSVKYDLSAKGFDNDEAVNEAVNNDKFTNEFGGKSSYGNKIVNTNSDNSTSRFGADVKGTNINGGSNLIEIYDDNIQKAVTNGFNEFDIIVSTINHEIGHNLGGEHGDPNPVNKDHIYLGYRTKPNCYGNGCSEPYVEKTKVTPKFGETIIRRIEEPKDVYYLNKKKQE